MKITPEYVHEYTTRVFVEFKINELKTDLDSHEYTNSPEMVTGWLREGARSRTKKEGESCKKKKRVADIGGIRFSLPFVYF